MGKQIPGAKSVNPAFAEECGDICAVPANLKCYSGPERKQKVEPEEEVKPTWVNGLNCLADINKPALLFPPQDIVPGKQIVEKYNFSHKF